jgi:predicted O-methyltransferase YrrM
MAMARKTQDVKRRVERSVVLRRNLARSGIPIHRSWRWVSIAGEATHNRSALQKLSEFAPLVGLVGRQRPLRVLEIGTHRGGTFWVWCQVAADDAKVISVDLPAGAFGDGDYDESLVRSYAGDRQQVELIRDDSHNPDTRERVVRALEGEPLDFLFLDGDHTYEGVRADFEMYAPLVRPGGMVAFHDIIEHPEVPECEVERVWNEVKPQYRHVELVDPGDVRGWGPWGGIGIIWRT